MRKIIQISAIAAGTTGDTGNLSSLFALCNDGSVWCMFGDSGTWEKAPNIPQDGYELVARSKKIISECYECHAINGAHYSSCKDIRPF